jgi:hypothetical protein
LLNGREISNIRSLTLAAPSCVASPKIVPGEQANQAAALRISWLLSWSVFSPRVRRLPDESGLRTGKSVLFLISHLFRYV